MTIHTAPGSLLRTLRMTVPGSNDVSDIVVRIGLPERDPLPGGDFRVLLEIDGFDEPYSRHFHGVDQLQAFLAGCWIVPQLLPVLAPPGIYFTGPLGVSASAGVDWLGGGSLVLPGNVAATLVAGPVLRWSKR